MPQTFDVFFSDLKLQNPEDRSLEKDYKKIALFYAEAGNSSTPEEFLLAFQAMASYPPVKDGVGDGKVKKMVCLALAFEAFINNANKHDPSQIADLPALRDRLLEIIAPKLLQRLEEPKKGISLFTDRWEKLNGKKILDESIDVRIFSDALSQVLARRSAYIEPLSGFNKIYKEKAPSLLGDHDKLISDHLKLRGENMNLASDVSSVSDAFELAAADLISNDETVDSQQPLNENPESNVSQPDPSNSPDSDSSSVFTVEEAAAEDTSEYSPEDAALQAWKKIEKLKGEENPQDRIESILSALPFEHLIAFLEQLRDVKLYLEEKWFDEPSDKFWQTNVRDAIISSIAKQFSDSESIKKLQHSIEELPLLRLKFADAIAQKTLPIESDDLKFALATMDSALKPNILSKVIRQGPNVEIGPIANLCRPFDQAHAISALKIAAKKIQESGMRDLAKNAFLLIFATADGVIKIDARIVSLIVEEINYRAVGNSTRKALVHLIDCTEKEILNLCSEAKEAKDLITLFAAFYECLDKDKKEDKFLSFLSEIKDQELRAKFFNAAVSDVEDSQILIDQAKEIVRHAPGDSQKFILALSDAGIAANMLSIYLEYYRMSNIDAKSLISAKALEGITSLSKIKSLLDLATKFTELSQIAEDETSIDLEILTRTIREIHATASELEIDKTKTDSAIHVVIEAILSGRGISYKEKLELLREVFPDNEKGYEKYLLNPTALGVTNNKEFRLFVEEAKLSESQIISFAKSYFAGLADGKKTALIENISDNPEEEFEASEDSEEFYRALEESFSVDKAKIAATLLFLGAENTAENILSDCLIEMSKAPSAEKTGFAAQDEVIEKLKISQKDFIGNFFSLSQRTESLLRNLDSLQRESRDFTPMAADKAIVAYNGDLQKHQPSQPPFSLEDRIEVFERFSSKENCEDFSLYRRLLGDLTQAAREIPEKKERDSVFAKLQSVCDAAFLGNDFTKNEIRRVLHPEELDQGLDQGLRENPMANRMRAFQQENDPKSMPVKPRGKQATNPMGVTPSI